MVALTASQRLNLPLAPIAAMIVGGAAAAAIAVVPTWRIEGLVLDLGLPDLFPPAEPPLGMTARLLMVLLAWGLAAGLTYLAARHLVDTAPRRAAPTLRRADAHPDAPSREPVMAARDLGTPFLDVTAPADPDREVALPADLDVPLAGFDPAAIPLVPAAPSVAVAPLCRPPAADAEARIETFELTPPVRSAPQGERRPDAIAAPETDATIHALLERLERGVARRRTTPAMTERHDALGLDDAMTTLRRFATR